MDIRVKKTQRSIEEAFMALRARKPLEKITVKELCQLAEINKSTFYAHYLDLFDLSDHLEQQAIQQVMDGIPTPTMWWSGPRISFWNCSSVSGIIPPPWTVYSPAAGRDVLCPR